MRAHRRSRTAAARRPLTTALLVALLLVATAGCGGGSGSSDGDVDASDGPGRASPGGSGPVTIDHRYGSTVVEDPPERIVALDNQWTDVLVALGAPLVGAALDPVLPAGRHPWQDVIPDSVTDIEVSDRIPYEAVAALDPDLIVITWGAPERSDYELLSQIAPTIPLLGDEEIDAWEDIATVAGEVLGDPEGAAALVAEVDGLATDLAADLPGLDGKTYALANYVAGDGIYVVADPDDGAASFFAKLGMRIDPDLVAAADGASGRLELSLERVDELDADVLVLLANGADPSEIPGYTGLPAVRSGAVAQLDVSAVTGLNTPTPLSLPYSVEQIRPALEAAAG